MNLPFLTKKTVDGVTSYTYTGKSTLRIYIPSDNFKRTNGRKYLSSRSGRLIETVGIFYFYEANDLYFFSLPIHIKFEYSEEVESKYHKLNKDIPPGNYSVFILKNGDKFMYDDMYVINSKDAAGILNSFYQAYLPNNISYNDTFNILLNAFQVTNMKFPAISVLLEALISQMYRTRGNLYKPFRMVYNGKNKYSYSNINIKKVPEVSSLFSSLVGEDGYYQLTQVVANKDNKKLTRKNAIEKTVDIQLGKE